MKKILDNWKHFIKEQKRDYFQEFKNKMKEREDLKKFVPKWDMFLKIVDKKTMEQADKMRQQVLASFKNPSRKKSYLSIVGQLTGKPSKELAEFYDNKFLPSVEKTINDTPVVSTVSGRMSPGGLLLFIEDPNVGAFFEERARPPYIGINPFRFWQGSNWGDGELLNLHKAITEEIIHAIDYQVSGESLFPDAPTGMTLSKMYSDKIKSLLRNKEKSGLSPEEYDYITSEREAYAKLRVLKSVFDNPRLKDRAYNPDGTIKPEFVKYQIKQAQKTPGGERILKALDIDKIEDISKLIDQLASFEQEKMQKTSQMA